MLSNHCITSRTRVINLTREQFKIVFICLTNQNIIFIRIDIFSSRQIKSQNNHIALKLLHQNSSYLSYSRAFRKRIYLFNKSTFIFERRDDLNSNSINFENEFFELYHSFDTRFDIIYSKVLHLLAILLRISKCIICQYDYQIINIMTFLTY